MLSRPLIALLLGLAALQAPAFAANNPNAIEELLRHSPFGSADINSAAIAAVNEPLEFRAVLEEHGQKFFSIYETGTRRSTWVDMKIPPEGLKVEAYDDTQECLTVRYQGKSLMLHLMGSSTKVRAAPAQLAQGPTAQAGNEYHDKPFRIGHVAEETEIRRAMRRSNATPVNPPAVPSAPDQH